MLTREQTLDQARLTPDELRAYWEDVSQRHLGRSDDGLEVICYAGMPLWFNHFFDRYQRLAFARLTSRMDFSGARVLDLGTGVGRWAHWFAERGAAEVIGIDLERHRLSLARERKRSPRIDYQQMTVDGLAFASGTFDVVNTVTVLQHVDDDTKAKAIDEVARVLRPGGRAILFEVTDLGDDAAHLFPWTQDRWRSEFQARGLAQRRTVGEQYIPIFRLVKRCHGLLHGAHSRAEIDALKAGRASRQDKLKMLALRAAALVSYPMEEVCRFFPSRAARITGFLFERDA